MWLVWGRGRSPGLCVVAVGAWWVPVLGVVVVGAWRVPWGSCGRCVGIECPLVFVWPRCGRGGSPVLFVIAVGAWLVPKVRVGTVRARWVPKGLWSCCWGESPGLCVAAVGAGRVRCGSCGCRGAWQVPWDSCGRRGGGAGLPGSFGRRGGVADPLGLYGCRGAWQIPWLFPWPPWGMPGHLGFVWLPWGVAGLLVVLVAAVLRAGYPGVCVIVVAAWRVPWHSCGSRGGVVGPLRFLCPPWGRGWSSSLCAVAVGAWRVPCTSCGRGGGEAGPLGFVW